MNVCNVFHSLSLARQVENVNAFNLSDFTNPFAIINSVRSAGLHLADGPNCNKHWSNAASYYENDAQYAISLPTTKRSGNCASPDVPIVFSDSECASTNDCAQIRSSKSEASM